MQGRAKVGAFAIVKSVDRAVTGGNAG